MKAIEKIDKTLVDTNKENVKTFLKGVNQRVKDYDSQYQVLLKELGVLCPSIKEDTINVFFKTINDFLQLGLTTSPPDSNEYKTFDAVITLMNRFLKKEISDFEKAQPLEKALLVQITKSAWALTNPDKDMEKMAQQIGGKLKNKTRKNKNRH